MSNRFNSKYSFDDFLEKRVTKFRKLNIFFSVYQEKTVRNTRKISNAVIKFEFLCCAFFPPFPSPLYYQASLERTFNSSDIYVISLLSFFFFYEKRRKRKEEKNDIVHSRLIKLDRSFIWDGLIRAKAFPSVGNLDEQRLFSEFIRNDGKKDVNSRVQTGNTCFYVVSQDVSE